MFVFNDDNFSQRVVKICEHYT